MKNRTSIAISVVIVAMMFCVSFWAWMQVHPGAAIPIHWNIYGQPDHFAKTPIGLFIAPAIAALIALLFAVIPMMEPRRLNLARSGKFYHVVWIATLLLLACVHGLTLYSAMHRGVAVGNIVIAAVCLLMIVIGNYLGKTRSMFLGGVRTPWTLSSEYSWQHTHNLAGKLFIAAGAIGFTATIVLPLKSAALTFFCSIAVATLWSIAMSYVFWRRDPERRHKILPL